MTTKNTLITIVSHKLSISLEESSKIVNVVLETIRDLLTIKSLLKLTNFGTLSLRDRKERVVRNPRTGKKSILPGRKIVFFKACDKFLEEINHEDI